MNWPADGGSPENTAAAVKPRLPSVIASSLANSEAAEPFCFTLSGGELYCSYQLSLERCPGTRALHGPKGLRIASLFGGRYGIFAARVFVRTGIRDFHGVFAGGRFDLPGYKIRTVYPEADII